MLPSLPRVYLLLGFFSGYILVLLFNPVRPALRDGLRCIGRFPRVWITFGILGFAYSIFQFLAFSPAQTIADFDPHQMASMATWQWPSLADVWMEAPLPALENVAGLFDNATTTYPLSVIAAIALLLNWRGLHGALLRALRKRYRLAGFLIYLVVLISALAALLKPIVFWRLPEWSGVVPEAGLLQISATVDAVAFIFEYLFGVYIQVYLIMICFVWIRGLSFEQGELFRFAVRRFSHVLKWAGLLVLFSLILVRLPLLLAYFMNIPNVLDYLPFQRILMCILIISFASVQVSLALHNENLGAAIRAHFGFIRRNRTRFGWFLLICAFHFFFIMACDAVVRGAVADRMLALIAWKTIFICLRGYITGWLLASWVCLFRQHETGRVTQESWIQY
jgi:hypothetical protein